MATSWVLGMVFFVGVILVSSENMGGVNADNQSCGFPALFNFGDDNSDGGQHQALYADMDLPNGQTFFGKSSGRYCDGRVITDFIAEHLGFPFLNAYLDIYNTSFRHGANFAIGGSSIRVKNGYNYHNLQRQVYQFAQFMTRTSRLDSKDQSTKNNFPKPEDFSNTLFIFDIGQNDFAFDFQNSSPDAARKAIPSMIGEFSGVIENLIEWFKGKHVWAHNVGPIGCLPYHIKSYQKRNPGCAFDQNGCVKELNDVVQEYNAALKKKIYELRVKFPSATFTYVDVYSAKYNLISNAKNLGFGDPMKFCCGSYENDRYIACSQKDSSGRVIGTACKDSSKYVSWDGIHYTDAANQYLAKFILNGSLSDPPLPLAQACRRA